MNIRPPRIGPQPWDVVRTKLDQSLPFANMRDTPYYRDAIYEQYKPESMEDAAPRTLEGAVVGRRSIERPAIAG